MFTIDASNMEKYKANLTPRLYIQPDAQFIINPGGTQDLRNAFVIGARVSLNF